MAMSDTMRPNGDENERIGEDGQVAPFAPDNTPPAEDGVRTDDGEILEATDEISDTEELELSYEETRLPWLEGDDVEEESGFAGGQLAALVVLSLVALALIGGGIYWATRSSPDGDLVADGSVVEAPNQPYKERPADPGGKTFEGTGDSSFALSEGQERPAQLGEASPAAKPGFETVEAPAATVNTPAAKQAPSREAPVAQETSGVGVQVAAYTSRATAEEGWATLSRQYEALSGMKHRVIEGQADIGKVYRLQAVPGGLSEANALCRSLKSAGLNCHVKQ